LTNIGRDFVNSLPPTVAQQTPETVDNLFSLSDEEWGVVSLSAEQSRGFLKCVHGVQRELAPSWDEKSIFDLSQRMVTRYANPKRQQAGMKRSQRASAALEEWTSVLLEAPADWTLYFRACNLSAQGLPATVGLVTFLPLDETGPSEIWTQYQAVMMISPDPAASKENWRKHMAERLRPEAGHSLARVCVQANTYRAAANLALSEVRRTLDVLNFYADLIHARPTVVFLPGDAARASQFVVAYKRGSSGDPVAAHFSEQIVGIWSAMGLFDPHLQKARDLGFGRACSLLTKSSCNAVERRVLTALRWAGQAGAANALREGYQDQLNAEREHGFLFYAICLESLFCKRREQDGATKRIADRCAVMLASDEPERAAIHELVATLYDRRSDIVHQGNLGITDDEMVDIRRLTCASLVEMLTNVALIALGDEGAFEDWFQNQRIDLVGFGKG